MLQYIVKLCPVPDGAETRPLCLAKCVWLYKDDDAWFFTFPSTIIWQLTGCDTKSIFHCSANTSC